MQCFLSRDDLQKHLDDHHHYDPRPNFFGVQWCHEGTKLTEQGSLFENSGEWRVFCPEPECAVTHEIYNLSEIHTSSMVEHAKTQHDVSPYYFDEYCAEKLVNIMKCTRWMCPRSDCQKIFHRHADFRRHLPTHDSSQRPLPCLAEGCERRDPNGFSRMDHLRNHMRAKHPSLAEELMKPKQRRRRQQKGKARLL